MKKLLFTALLLSLYVPSAFATPGVNDWSKTAPLESLYIDDGRDKIEYNFQAIDRLQSNYRRGCGIKYNTVAQVTVEDGELMVSNAAGTTRVMAQNTSDTVVTWANIDTGSEATSTTYYIYATVTGDDDQAQSYVISLSSTAPTGETYYRRLGSFYNNAAGNIEKIQNDDNYVTDVYDSGYFACALNTAYVVTHSLNTTDLDISVYFATDSSGSNMQKVGSQVIASSGGYGALVTDITSTQLTVRSGTVKVNNAYDFGGTPTQYTSGYYKVIVRTTK